LQRFRAELIGFLRENLMVSNCVEWLEKILEHDPAQLVDHGHVLAEIKIFFIKNWNKVVFLPNLENLPTRVLVEFMKLRISDDGIKKMENALTVFRENCSVKTESLSYACLQLHESRENANVKILFGSSEIFLHKYVLSANAPHHHLPTTDDFKIDCQTQSDLKHFENLIKYIYARDFFESRAIDLEEAHGLWQTGMYFLDSRVDFEGKLCRWFMSGLDEKSIFRILDEIEQKPYALILRDAALDYVAENITILGKLAQMNNIPKPILVEVLVKLC